MSVSNLLGKLRTLIVLVCLGMMQPVAFGGYVNVIFRPGENLFGNPLDSASVNTNQLSDIIRAPPEGTVVALWNPALNDVAQSSVFSSGAWSVDFLMPPGLGARLTAPAQFTNTFVGGLLNPDGTPYPGDGPFIPPSPFTGLPGTYLLACKTPFSSLTGIGVFMNVLGRGPKEGEVFRRLDAVTQSYVATTFVSGGWNNGDPILGAGQAAFFTVVPEPGAVALWVMAVVVSMVFGLGWWHGNTASVRNAVQVQGEPRGR